MATISDVLKALVTDVDGSIAALLGDTDSGMLLASAGGGIDVEVAAAGTTEIMRAQQNTLRALKHNDVVEDILITLGTQYQIVRPLSANRSVFIYLALDRARSNLALARLAVKAAEQSITI